MNKDEQRKPKYNAPNLLPMLKGIKTFQSQKKKKYLKE